MQQHMQHILKITVESNFLELTKALVGFSVLFF